MFDGNPTKKKLLELRIMECLIGVIPPCFGFKFEFKTVISYKYYMNLKKDSKRQKTKGESKDFSHGEKFQSPMPRKINPVCDLN